MELVGLLIWSFSMLQAYDPSFGGTNLSICRNCIHDTLLFLEPIAILADNIMVLSYLNHQVGNRCRRIITILQPLRNLEVWNKTSKAPMQFAFGVRKNIQQTICATCSWNPKNTRLTKVSLTVFSTFMISSMKSTSSVYCRVSKIFSE